MKMLVTMSLKREITTTWRGHCSFQNLERQRIYRNQRVGSNIHSMDICSMINIQKEMQICKRKWKAALLWKSILKMIMNYLWRLSENNRSLIFQKEINIIKAINFLLLPRQSMVEKTLLNLVFLGTQLLRGEILCIRTKEWRIMRYCLSRIKRDNKSKTIWRNNSIRWLMRNGASLFNKNLHLISACSFQNTTPL